MLFRKGCFGSRGLSSIVFAVVLGISWVEGLNAQEKPTTDGFLCPPLSGDSPWTTIVVKLNNQGVCVVDPFGDSYPPRLTTHLAGPAYWNLCNYCGNYVDLRLNFSLGDLDLGRLLPSMRPLPDPSNQVTNRKLPTGLSLPFQALATNDWKLVGYYDYDVLVKLSSEDETKWRRFHPQIQIDTVNIRLRNVILLILGISASMGAGVWIGRRLAHQNHP